MRSLIPKVVLTQDDEGLEHNSQNDIEENSHSTDNGRRYIDVLHSSAPTEPPRQASTYDSWQPLPPLPQVTHPHFQSSHSFTASPSGERGQHGEDEAVFSEDLSGETSSLRPSSYAPSEDDSLDIERYMEEIDRYISQVDGYVGSIAADATSNREIHHYLAYKKAEDIFNAHAADPTDPFAHRRIYAAVEKEYADEIPPEVFHELPNRDHTGNHRSEWTQKDIEDYYPPIKDPSNPARILRPKEITFQRAVFLSIVISLNAGALVAALLSKRHLWVLVFILFIKSKDCISVILVASNLLFRKVRSWMRPQKEVQSQWILSLIPTYSETEEQIVKTIYSLRDNGVEPHRQVICVIIDGKPRDIKAHLTRKINSFKRPYVTSKFKRGQLNIDTGFMQDVPVVIFEKVSNAGKKDSLILCHDLFNHPREDMPLYSKLLRTEIWQSILPVLTYRQQFSRFDMIFCTDADSIIHSGAVAALADALVRGKNCIAACGLVLVEFELGREWSFWNLYQQFQYTFGQYIRRRAESVWGKVTCLPGCITMIAVRPEMAGAMSKYAQPVTAYPVILHQVQYLGTDRRLTYSMLSQSKKLTTAFVPNAVSETVAPLSLGHYLSQRRRWGSNAYFNNIFYCYGSKMIWITRLASLTELLRLTMVYYRLANTVMFLYGLATTEFSWLEIIPLAIVSELPTVWFVFTMAVLEKPMRNRGFKMFLGFCINKCISPLISVTVFTKVATNLGSQVWGLTGGSNALAAAKEEAAKAAALDIAVSDGATTNEKSRHTSVQLTDGSTIVVETLGNGKLLIINEDEEEEEVIGVPVANLPEPELVDFEREEKLAGMLP